MTRRIDDVAVVEMTEAGMTAVQIAEALGCTPASVSRSRVRSGVDRCRRVDADRVVVLTEAGWTAERIARELGCASTTVHRIRVETLCSRSPAKRMTADEVARVEAMLADGCSVAEAARTLGRNPGSLARRFAGRGMPNAESVKLATAARRANAELRRAGAGAIRLERC